MNSEEQQAWLALAQWPQLAASWFVRRIAALKQKPTTRLRFARRTPLDMDVAIRVCALLPTAEDQAQPAGPRNEGRPANYQPMEPITYTDLDLDELRDGLAYFFDFIPDERLLREILDNHSNLVAEAQEFGWGDTEVRDKLAGLVCETLIGRPWPTYGETETQGIGINEFHQQVQEAHDRWIAELDQA